MSLRRDPKLIQIINEQTRQLRKHSTRAERILWERLRNRRFLNFKFYRQYPIIHDLGGRESFFILDFYCHQKRIGIEVDGDIHKARIKEDKMRDEILERMGIRVVRIKNKAVEKNLDTTLDKLKIILSMIS